MPGLTAFERSSISAISFVAHEDEMTSRARNFLTRLKARLDTIGSSAEAIKGRVLGDNALGIQEFGESDFVHWR